MTPFPPLRVAFFGTPDFAVPTLAALIASRHAVAVVVTQPDRPSGRGQKTKDTPVKALAAASGIRVLQPERLKTPAFIEELRSQGADIAVVAAYGKILPEEILRVPPLGFVNVHASLLPKYRGAAPVHRAVIAGERVTGVTIMRVVRALDAGPMLAHLERPISGDETSAEVEQDLARLGAGLLVTVLDRISEGRVDETPQDDRLATYAHKLTREDGVVDWRWPAERIHNLVRGLHPWPHACAFLDDSRIILRQSRWSSQPSPEAPGTIVGAAGDRLVVATGQGLIELTEVQPEGKRPMAARDFLAGHPLAPGHRFRTP